MIITLCITETTHTVDSTPIVLIQRIKGGLLEAVEAKHKEAQNERRNRKRSSGRSSYSSCS